MRIAALFALAGLAVAGCGSQRVTLTVHAGSPLADSPVEVDVRGLDGPAALRARWRTSSTFPRLVHGAIGLVPNSVVDGAPGRKGTAWTYRGRPVTPENPIPVAKANLWPRILRFLARLSPPRG